jgi:hypothetical protein
MMKITAVDRIIPFWITCDVVVGYERHDLRLTVELLCWTTLALAYAFVRHLMEKRKSEINPGS